jgi:hypothetical protein
MSRGSHSPSRGVALCVLLGLVLAALPALACAGGRASQPEASTAASTGHTAVSIEGTSFLVNGAVTNPGTPAEGLLLNSRMVQAVFDDENPSTRSLWAYPDTGAWDPERNTNEFVAAVPAYADEGLNAVTVNLQGGRPVANDHPLAEEQPWNVSAYETDGSLKAAWTERLERVLRVTDENGIVVILGLFYFGQDQRLADESAVVKAVDSVTDWLLSTPYRNVLVEIDNECDASSYDQSILRCGRVGALVQRVQSRSQGRLKVSVSLKGGVLPPDELVGKVDFVLLHGNQQRAAGVRTMVAKLRGGSSYRASAKPVVFNEDSTSLDNMDAAIGAGASWGYYDKGENDYRDGFQAPPVQWSISTDEKRAFFARVASLTGRS